MSTELILLYIAIGFIIVIGIVDFIEYKQDIKFFNHMDNEMDKLEEENKKLKNIHYDFKTHEFYHDQLEKIMIQYTTEYIELRMKDAMFYKGSPVFDMENKHFEECSKYAGEKALSSISDNMYNVLLETYSKEGLNNYIISYVTTISIKYYNDFISDHKPKK